MLSSGFVLFPLLKGNRQQVRGVFCHFWTVLQLSPKAYQVLYDWKKMASKRFSSKLKLIPLFDSEARMKNDYYKTFN